MVNCQQLEKQIKSLKEMVREGIKDVINQINEVKDDLLLKLSNFEEKITQIENDNIIHSEKIVALETKTENQSQLINTLTTRIETLEKGVNGDQVFNGNKFEEKIKSLEESIEDRTNRQLRETLIIKGIPEEDNEDWERTKQIIAETISNNIDNLSYDDAYNEIKRAHREHQNNIRKDKRHIFAAFYSWNLCEELKKKFRLIAIQNNEFKITIESKYGPLTTWRRNKALERRKLLKADNKILSGYVAYPAKLMVKYPGQDDEVNKNYTIHEDFSEMHVVYEKRE